MKILKEKEIDYKKFKELNTKDFYSKGVVDYAERWANMMEDEISNGKNIEDIAESISFKADTEGITGFMFGCAKDTLIKYWEYGEILEKLKNKGLI